MQNDLEGLLKNLRTAIIEGNYAVLIDAATQIDEASTTLREPSLSSLQQIKAEALHTASCLESAISGIRSARRRMVEIDEAARGLTTYDRSGAKATVPATSRASRRV
jgi:hypothetical protein